MLYDLLDCICRLLTGVGFDDLWTGHIYNYVVPTFFGQWTAQLFALPRVCIRSFLMGIIRKLDLLCSLVLAVFSSSTFAGNVSLPSYPLAVKSPYLSAWVPGNQLLSEAGAATAQPQFWTGSLLTWPIFARIDNETYALFGNTGGDFNATPAVTNSVSYTSSHTYINIRAGGATLTLDFFSPVLPGKEEYACQSLPYSYLTVSATSSSNLPPHVSIFTAVRFS